MSAEERAALTEAEWRVIRSSIPGEETVDGWELALVRRTIDRTLADRANAERDERLRAAVEAAKALHPKIEAPTHGCCAHPKLCRGHVPECGGKEHGLNRPAWPCPTLRALAVADPEAQP